MKPAGIASRGALTRQLRLFEGGTQREGHAIADAGPRSSWRLHSSTAAQLHSFTTRRRRSRAASSAEPHHERVPAERGDAGRRCRAALEKVQAQQGGGFREDTGASFSSTTAAATSRRARYAPRGERNCTKMQAACHATRRTDLYNDSGRMFLRRATARVEVEDARGHSISHSAAQKVSREGDAPPYTFTAGRTHRRA